MPLNCPSQSLFFYHDICFKSQSFVLENILYVHAFMEIIILFIIKYFVDGVGMSLNQSALQLPLHRFRVRPAN